MTAGPSHFEVCHWVPGRVRVKARAIRAAEKKAHDLAYWLNRQAGVREASASPITGSIILHYDPSTPRETLFELLNQAISDLPRLTDLAPEPCPGALERLRSGEAPSLGWGLAKVAAITGFLGLNLIRSVWWGAPFSAAVVTGAAVAAALPLWYRALADIRNFRFLGLNTLLGSAAVLAIATAESFTALEVIWILEIGEFLEEYVADRSRRAIQEILAVSAKNAYVLVNGVEVETPVDRVQAGDILAVGPLEKIPVDGVIVEGEALVDQAHITGRSEPDFQQPGDPVFAGAMVQEGRLFIRAEKVGEATYISQIICLVEQSLINRPRAEKQVEVLAARLTRLGMLATAGTLILTWDLTRVFAVMLVMACPCATILAASTAVTAALANAANRHILIKGGLYLERLGETDCFCFDKTGTLTTGLPRVAEIVPARPGASPRRILALAAAAEGRNPHPLARALVREAEASGRAIPAASGVETFLGRGVRAVVGTEVVRVGNRAVMAAEGVDLGGMAARAAGLEEAGHTVIFVAKNQELQGVVGIAAEARQGLEAILAGLRRSGVRELHLISGDTPRMVQSLAQPLGFDGCGAALLPEDKARYVEGLAARGLTVAVIGDGVNDGPALSQADVGVAMGAGGSEAAVAAADISLADDDLHKLIFLRQLSLQTVRVIHQNYWLALTTDLVGAALALWGRLSPVVGGLIHVGHAAAILANSGRLLTWKPADRGRRAAGD